jgi:hypothetical protein
MLVGVRDRLIRNRTQLTNAIRGHEPPRVSRRQFCLSQAAMA